jgi:hypothetical protein
MDDPDVELPRLLFCDSEKGARHGIVQEIVPSDDCTCQVTAPEYKEIFTLRRRYIPRRRSLAISKSIHPLRRVFHFWSTMYGQHRKLGSSSPQVLLKNATNLDKLVNGRNQNHYRIVCCTCRKTWHGMEMIFNRFSRLSLVAASNSCSYLAGRSWQLGCWSGR